MIMLDPAVFLRVKPQFFWTMGATILSSSSEAALTFCCVTPTWSVSTLPSALTLTLGGISCDPEFKCSNTR